MRRAHPHDRDAIEKTIKDIIAGKVKGKKLKGSSYFKVREGRFRIMYHLAVSGEIEIDEIRPRNEKTYRDF